jgi:hypothetical protein
VELRGEVVGSGQPLMAQRCDVVASGNVGAGCFVRGTSDLLVAPACLPAGPASSRVTRIEMIAAIRAGSAIPVDISKGAWNPARGRVMVRV